jgi:predicted nucleic acid-binding protein
VALRNRRDSSHDLARTLLVSHAAEPLVTSNYVRGETLTFIRRRAGHRSAVDFLDSIDRPPRLRLRNVPQDVETAALRWFRRHDEREYSFVDATSFALMRSLRIRETLAF